MNVADVFRGRIDISLNEKGIKQAELLANYLRVFEIEAVYSSALQRALKTAQTITRHHGLEVKTNPGLMDFDFGEWEGLSRKEVQEKYKELYLEFVNHPETARMPGGESLDEVKDRAMRLVDEITSVNKGTVVLVSHCVITRVIICALLGLDNSHFWNIEHSTCGITTFLYQKGQFILLEHNNTSFLKSN
jgi:broad specificity phosphatase PhoE